MVVLVVEDEAIIACCSAAMLEEAGHEVIGPAHTSTQAMELVCDRAPDVALIDIDLEVPGAGIGVARQLRTQFGTAIVFTTGRMDLAQTHSDLAVAALSKPYDPSELAGIVEIAGSQRRASPSRTTPSRTANFTGAPRAQRLRRISEPGPRDETKDERDEARAPARSAS